MAKAVRLDKFLADAGKGTRSEVKKFIQKGQVQVNGTPAKKPELKVDPDKDEVIFAGEMVSAAPEFVYYLLNKPAGCVSATEDRNDRTVMEYVPSDRKGLFPVGRLDKDTEGLLLITDDGMLAHELLAPGKHVDKTYRVRPEKPLSAEDIHRLESGLEIGDDKPTSPAKAVLTEDGDLLLTIHEGRFHQVKRMLQAIGNQVLTLERIRFGPLSLDPALSRGDYRALTEEEIKHLRIKE